MRSASRFVRTLVVGLGLVGASASARAGFDPQVGQPGSLGIPASSPLFAEWASSVASFDPGPQDITSPDGPPASAGSPADVLGPPTSGVLSLGDGGSITLGFDRAIANGAGADFAVFENGFLIGGAGMAFLELAFVDVSSDGVHFFRFPSISLTPTDTQVGGFGALDASNLYNLAGKYISGYGTGFNLDGLVGVSPLLDVDEVKYVRITDVVGSIDPRYGRRDSLGNLINDPFRTPFASSGFDLTGVGVVNMATLDLPAAPEPSSLVMGFCAIVALAGPTSIRSRARRSAGSGRTEA